MSKEMLISASDVIPEIFLNGKYTDILKIIKEKATIKNPSTEKTKDRQLIISTAAKIASSKTFLLKIGKDLSDKKRDEIKEELETILSVRNEIEENLNALKDEVRKPVTDWENKKKAEEEEKQRIIDYDNLHITALAENIIEDERREMVAENERLKKEAEKKRIEDQANINAEKKVEDQRLAGLKREREAGQKLEQAGIDKEILAGKVKDKAGKARQEILLKIGVSLDFPTLRNMEESAWNEFFELKNDEYQTKQKSEFVKELKEKREAEENRLKQEQINRENDKAHWKKINNEILSSMTQNDIPEDCARNVIILIAQGKIANLKINY